MKARRWNRVAWVVLAVVLAAAMPAVVVAQVTYDMDPKLSQDGTAVPDVNKIVAPPAPPPPALPAPPDDTCWQATAANILAGAGWGLAANNAQVNATAIYGHLTNHFGFPKPGWAYVAINWWLVNYGLNPTPGNLYYNPTGSYTDVTYQICNTAADYDFLIGELQRCQYVGVAFQKATGVGHEFTMVGGNYSPWPPAGKVSINAQQVSLWHDSDRTLAADDVISNVWMGPNNNQALWYIAYNGLANPPFWPAERYTTLCPGLHKPGNASQNYDAAWYKDMNPANGNLFNAWRVAGAKAGQFGQPGWSNDNLSLTIYNEEMMPPWHKEIWLLVDYLDRNNNVDPGILLITSSDMQQGKPPRVATDIFYSDDFGQILFHWVLPDQPGWEKILFPNVDYFNLAIDVKDFDIATLCVPEPATLALVGMGLALVAAHRRGKK